MPAVASSFAYRDARLWCDEVAVEDLAREYGTPLYVYSRRQFEANLRHFADAFGAMSPAPLLCYSVKANSTLAVLEVLRDAGAAFDIVSGGELARVQAIGVDPRRVVFAGVGKSVAEIDAALSAGILLFNVESEAELDRLNARAQAAGTTAPVALRLNPDVDPQTHTHITTGARENKFGIDLERAAALVDRWAEFPHCRLTGIHIHIGSQVFRADPYLDALERALPLVRKWGNSHALTLLNLGGGFGVHYEAFPGSLAEATGEGRFDAIAYATALAPIVAETGLRLVLEPGRAIAASAGALITTVEYVKESGAGADGKVFVLVDAAMNDLLRPSLYDAYHGVWPSVGPPEREVDAAACRMSDVVGPICESGDFLARDRLLPPVSAGARLAVFHAGAYGMTMASNYNTRPRAAEVLVTGTKHRLARRRETLDDLLRAERDAIAHRPTDTPDPSITPPRPTRAIVSR